MKKNNKKVFLRSRFNVQLWFHPVVASIWFQILAAGYSATLFYMFNTYCFAVFKKAIYSVC